MRRLLVGLAIAGILSAGTLAVASGPGFYGYGPMMGSGYGGHMMGWSGGGPMMGWYGRGMSAADEKFLDETADLRQELNTKRFEYFEAARKSEPNTETLTTLEKEITDLQDQIYAKAPEAETPYAGRYGRCW